MDPETKDDTQCEGHPPASAEPAPAAPDAATGGTDTPAAGEHPPEPKKGPDHEDARSLRGKLKKKDHEIKDLKQQLEDLRREADSLKDRYLRAAAEMDNQRKRLDRDRSEYLQYAQGELLKDLLAVVDNFERALKTSAPPSEGARFQEGVELIAKQLLDLIRKRGVTPIPAAGATFDPAVHQAVLTEEADDVAEPMIGEELQKGYLLHDRLLRPALVKVLVPKNPS
jgi:molecular chaperone GrpE